MEDIVIEFFAKEYEKTEDCKLLREFAASGKTYLEQKEFAREFQLQTFAQFLAKKAICPSEAFKCP